VFKYLLGRRETLELGLMLGFSLWLGLMVMDVYDTNTAV
jgi:hypothetical protein